MAEQLNRTPLYGIHVSLKGRIVPFAGWEMPLQYTGILAESRAVRASAGIFDVSHMGRLYISGAESVLLLDWIITADMLNMPVGRARYAMVCNEEGGIIDDTVTYRLGEAEFLHVCNAANRQHVLPWMQHWARERFPDTTIEDRTETTAMIAFQGPSTAQIMDLLCDGTPSTMRLFSATEGTLASTQALVGRTGYTGEDGFELIVAAEHAAHLWQVLMDQGAVPCGLGARDVLRLEAGLALHGHEITPTITPLEAGLGRFVKLDKEFAGAAALRRQRDEGPKRRLVGLILLSQHIAREGYPILADGSQVGTVTSGTHSPTLDRSIAMGYVTVELSSPGQVLHVDIRGTPTDAEVALLPFYTRPPSTRNVTT